MPALGSSHAKSLDALPDDLLIRCLQPLSIKKRFKSAAPVSQRFNRLCHTPQLLHTIAVDASYDSAEHRAASLLLFLMDHGQHVISLHLYLPNSSPELGALVASCLSVCGAAGRLEELAIREGTPLATTAWLAGLKSLRRLSLWCDGPLVLPRGFGKLRQLVDAELAGDLELEQGACLPPALTRLKLDHMSLPNQMSSLSALFTLELNEILELNEMQPMSFDPIASLPALRQLSLYSLDGLPAGLSTLTQLNRLVICQSTVAPDELWEELSHLHGLTALCLDDVLPCGNHISSIPSAIAQLPRLQRLYINCFNPHLDTDHSRYYPTSTGLSLPSGPWLSAIRWLGLPWPLLQAGAGVLRAALQLKYLFSIGTPYARSGEQAWAAFWEFVATHRPLRCLAYAAIEPDRKPYMIAAASDVVDPLLMLHRRCPGLQLRRLEHECATDRSLHSFTGQMLTCADIPVEGDTSGL